MGRYSSRRAISDEPLVNYVHRRLELVLAALITLFIFYTTFLPAVDNPSAPNASLLSAQHHWSKQDILQNILLYIPFGFFVALVFRRRHRQWILIIGSTVLSATAISGLAEFCQSLFPGRVSSLVDLACNASGASVGAVCAFVFKSMSLTSSKRIKTALRAQPVFMSTGLLAILYSICALVPFQLDLMPEANRTIFNPVRLTAFTPQQSVSIIDQDDDRRKMIDHFLDMGACAIGFALMGAFANYALRHELLFGRAMAAFLVLWMGLMLIGLLTVGQMFIRNIGFHAVFVPIGLTAAFAGILLTSIPPLHKPIPARWLVPVAWLGIAVCTIAIGIRELNPFDFRLDSDTINAQWASAGWIPLKKYFTEQNTASASSDILAKTIRAVVLGLLLGYGLAGIGVTKLATRMRVGFILSTIVAVSIEAIQLTCPHRHIDITHVLLIIIGGLVGIVAMQWWEDLLRASAASGYRRTASHVAS